MHLLAGDEAIAETMIARRGGGLSRVLRAALFTVGYTPVVGGRLALAWMAVYLLLQALDHLLFGSERARARPIRRVPALGWLSVNSLVFGAPALAAGASGPWGVLCALLVLTCGMLTPLMTNQGSRAAFIAAMWPLAAYFVFAAGAAGWMSGDLWIALAVSTLAGLTILTSHLLWQSGSQSVNARRRAIQEAERRRLEAESAAGAKSQFVAMISHELRTPISAILAGAEAIERSARGDAAASHAALIAESGRMMRTLLNDLLDLSKMEAGRIEIETIAFDPRAMVADTAAFWSSEAQKKGLKLRLTGEQALPAQAGGDPTRLRQILNNLFSNAIKFTDDGEVTLDVVVARLGEGERLLDETVEWLVRFTVADTGCGMGQAQLARLFTPFDQTQASTARTHGGTGLGLTISRQLARLMGGDLYAESRPEEGARFTLEVGLAEAPPVLEAPAVPAEPVEGVQVLVVDDHEINRRAIGLMLEPFGVQIVAAASAKAALELLAVRAFDVVLMDVHMPEMDGREACRRLRASGGPNQSAPVIACTASADARDWEECRQAGMNGRVIKPIDSAALHAAIAAAIRPADAALETAAA